LTNNAAAKFALAISRNCLLEQLDLSNNKIEDNGGEKLAIALIQNKTLKRLHLSSNQLATNTGISLLKMLENNCTLLHLCIDRNQIPIKLFEEVTEKINSNLKSYMQDGVALLKKEREVYTSSIVKHKLATWQSLVF
jgi:Leucine-rich repeat (LRR) protein